MGCVLDESTSDEAVSHRKVARWRRVTSGIRSLVIVGDLHLQYAEILHETLLVPFLMFSNETLLWKEKERSIIRAVQRIAGY